MWKHISSQCRKNIHLSDSICQTQLIGIQESLCFSIYMSLLSWQFFCFCENIINDRTFCNIDILKFIVADAIPSRRAMLLQIYVAMKAMPWYSVLPTISEYMTEIGWTKAFPRIYHIGWAAYLPCVFSNLCGYCRVWYILDAQRAA